MKSKEKAMIIKHTQARWEGREGAEKIPMPQFPFDK